MTGKSSAASGRLVGIGSPAGGSRRRRVQGRSRATPFVERIESKQHRSYFVIAEGSAPSAFTTAAARAPPSPRAAAADLHPPPATARKTGRTPHAPSPSDRRAPRRAPHPAARSEEHTSELQSLAYL